MPGSDQNACSRETVSMIFLKSQLMQANRVAWSCQMDITMLLRGLQLDLITRGSEFHIDQYIYSSVDIAISPTRRRRDHRCDSSSSCDPIASGTDLVSEGATSHHHTKSRTFPAEGFRAKSIPINRSMWSQYICEQQSVPHDAPHSRPRRRRTGRNRRAATSDDRGSKDTSHISARSALEDPSILLVQNW